MKIDFSAIITGIDGKPLGGGTGPASALTLRDVCVPVLTDHRVSGRGNTAAELEARIELAERIAGTPPGPQTQFVEISPEEAVTLRDSILDNIVAPIIVVRARRMLDPDNAAANSIVNNPPEETPVFRRSGTHQAIPAESPALPVDESKFKFKTGQSILIVENGLHGTVKERVIDTEPSTGGNRYLVETFTDAPRWYIEHELSELEPPTPAEL